MPPDPQLVHRTFEQNQQVRGFYSVADVLDVDRYEINGEMTQVTIGPRSINPAGVPGDSWEAAHVAYTHGYGVVLAPSNATVSSEPDFLVGNVPPQIDPSLSDSGFELRQPRLSTAPEAVAGARTSGFGTDGELARAPLPLRDDRQGPRPASRHDPRSGRARGTS